MSVRRILLSVRAAPLPSFADYLGFRRATDVAPIMRRMPIPPASPWSFRRHVRAGAKGIWMGWTARYLFIEVGSVSWEGRSTLTVAPRDFMLRVGAVRNS